MNVKEWYKSGEFTKVNELNIFNKRAGKGETLVCIHGFPSSSWDFEKIWPSLTARFDGITFDLIGLGKSAKPDRAISISLQADMIEELLIQKNVSKAHILAHDLGDTIAQELLARQAENNSKILWQSCIFLNGGLFPETHKALFIQKLLISPLGSFVAKFMSKNSFVNSMNGIFSKAHPPTLAFLDETWNLIVHNNGIAMIPRLIRYMKERKLHRERWLTPLVKNIVPLLLINGIEDPISGKHMADRYATLIPNANITLLENSGHYPHVETPNEVLKAILKFHEN